MNRMQRSREKYILWRLTDGCESLPPAREIYASDRDEGRVLHSATDRDGEQRKDREIDE